MSLCEKCWADARLRAAADSARVVMEHYQQLLDERRDKPCTIEEQKGDKR